MVNPSGPQGNYNPHFPQQPAQTHPGQAPHVTPPSTAPTSYPSVNLQPPQSKPYEKRKRNPLKITDPNTGQDVLASSSSGAVTSSSAAAASANASSVVEATKPSENDEVPEVRIDL